MLRGFTKKKVGSYTLGEQFKRLRSDGRVTLHEVSRETKIPVKYLEMIEDGRYESLPPDVYVKGFLRRYADFLGVDPNKIISLYARERDIKLNISGNGKPKILPEKKKIPRFVITPRIFTAAVIVLVVLGGFFYLYKEIGRFAAVPRLVLTQPGSNEASVEGNSLVIAGFTDEDAKLAINDQPVVVNDRGEFRENVILQEGVNTITINSVNRFGKTATQAINVRSDYEKPEISFGGDESGEGGQVSGEQSENREGAGVGVFVRVDSLPTWLSIESDGNLVYSGTMLPGATQDFKGEKEIRITSGKANQTFIKVNGRDERALADSPGIVRDVVFGPND